MGVPYGVVDDLGQVVNIVMWDGTSDYGLPESTTLVPIPAIEIDGETRWEIGVGWTYVNGEFVPPQEPSLTWDEIRWDRDRLLAASDWTQVADTPLTASEKQAWADYRQALRDVPQDFPTPDDVVWPEAP